MNVLSQMIPFMEFIWYDFLPEKKKLLTLGCIWFKIEVHCTCSSWQVKVYYYSTSAHLFHFCGHLEWESIGKGRWRCSPCIIEGSGQVLQGDFEAIVTWPWMHEEHVHCVSCPGCRCCYYVPKHGFLGLQETLRVAELPLKHSEFLVSCRGLGAVNGALHCHIGLIMSGIGQFWRMPCN